MRNMTQELKEYAARYEAWIREEADRLSEKEKTIVGLRYGLGNDKEHTQKEVADMMGISQSYISRLEKKIIVKLREELQKLA